MGGRDAKGFPPRSLPPGRATTPMHQRSTPKMGVQPSTSLQVAPPFLAHYLALVRGGSDDGGKETERETG
jgi:hypothetical protein